jgi:hypothetical protein
MPRRDLLLAAVPVVPVAVAVLAEGGYSDGPRTAFGAVALAAAGVALAVAPRGSGAGLAREPLVLVLLALAALGALSALWTLGPVDRTLRWALVTAGYAGVAVAAGVAASRPRGAQALAVALAALAIVAGAIGLGAAVLFEVPFAERIAGVWRPGGPFEYPPALALLELSALPVLLAGMVGRSRALAGVAAAGIALAGGVLALAASRVALALAVAVAGIAIARTPRRAPVAAAIALCAGAGAALSLAAGGAVRAGAAVEPGRAVAHVAIAVGAAAIWLTMRSLWRPAPAASSPPPPPLSAAAPAPSPGGPPPVTPSPARRGPATAAATAVAILLAAAAAGSLAFGLAPGRGGGPATGFLHGRADTWRAAAETFADRPAIGTGADAFLAGSARHQGGQTILFAHDLPLELAAELGIAGALLALALYGAAARLVRRARGTVPDAAWLFGPAVAAFLLASLVDWPWHLAGAGATWALAAGALTGTLCGAAKVPSGARGQDVPGMRTEPNVKETN